MKGRHQVKQGNLPGANPHKEKCKEQSNRKGEATKGDGMVEMVLVMVVMEGDEERMEKNGGTGESSVGLVGCLMEKVDGFVKFAIVDMAQFFNRYG
nr:hypothetical protein CFP56_19068 [Quercus suber]